MLRISTMAGISAPLESFTPTNLENMHNASPSSYTSQPLLASSCFIHMKLQSPIGGGDQLTNVFLFYVLDSIQTSQLQRILSSCKLHNLKTVHFANLRTTTKKSTSLADKAYLKTLSFLSFIWNKGSHRGQASIRIVRVLNKPPISLQMIRSNLAKPR